MAKNRVIPQANRRIPLATVAASSLSGAPMVVGKLPCVLLKDADTNNQAPVQLDGVWTMSVKAVDGSGNLAIAAGDIIYYVVGDTVKLSVKATGVRWGYALEAVTSGATASIKVQCGY